MNKPKEETNNVYSTEQIGKINQLFEGVIDLNRDKSKLINIRGCEQNPEQYEPDKFTWQYAYEKPPAIKKDGKSLVGSTSVIAIYLDNQTGEFELLNSKLFSKDIPELLNSLEGFLLEELTEEENDYVIVKNRFRK